ncbi:Serine/threonine-protein kinase TEL1 [Apiospora phragmitis]|uniref:Serine/threonine-protein kinase Tel1 n=1 Tax=Apiospora phragmitis TaxID=2905665 RepID=A0ABR1TPA6_9PEZI
MAPSTRVRGESIEDVRQTIDNGNLKNRQAALDDLIFFFSKKTKAADLSALSDKHYHQILDTLFRCAISEKQSFLGAKKTARGAAGKLAKCAEALRVVIESGASRLKRKTLVAIIDHITQTLPGPDADSVEPLVQGYIKALMALLSHPVNVELLATYDAEGWYDCVDFSLQTITRYIDAGDTDSDSYRSSPVPTAQTFSMTFSTQRSSAISSTQRSGGHMEKSRLHDLLNCLLSLISAANAPLQKRIKDISSIGIQVLKLPSSGVAASLQVAFSIINVALNYAQTDDIEHAGSLAAELVPLIGHWWQAKIASKDDALLNNLQVEMLKALYSMHMQLESLVQTNDSTLVANVEDLCDLLWSAYTRRDIRSQLQQDDLSYSAVPRHQYSLATHLFGLRLHNAEAERRWAVVHTLSLMEATLWRASHLTQARDEDEQEQPRKKRRMASGYSRLRQRLLSPDLNAQLAALQVIPFFVANVQITEAFMAETLSSLVNLAAHKNGNISVWAMIATASLAQTEHAQTESLAAPWKQLWFIASRNLMSRDLIQFHDISDDFHNIVTAADAVVGSLGEAWGLLQERRDIVRYLLLSDDDKASFETQKLQYFEAAPTSRAAATSDTYAVRKLIAELLYPEISRASSPMCYLECARRWLITHFPRKVGECAGFRDYRLLLPSAPDRSAPLSFFSKLSDEYQQLERLTSGHEEDGMDLDDEFGSQESRSTTTSKGLEISRRETVMLDTNSFHTDTIQRLHLLKILRDSPGQVGLVPHLFLDRFLALSDEELLLSKQLGRELLTGDAMISPDDQKLLIERFGTIMASSTYSSCETALALVLDVIEGLMPSWTDKRSGISEEVGDFYRFFVKSALPNNLLSDRIQTILARLLLSLTMIDEKYPEALGVPNTIQSILGILELGSVPVKFYIAQRLPVIFSRFVLKAHDDVFAESILHNLPTEPEFSEGISFRLYVLAELAQHWPTLLRRCVYHIFETAGQIQESAKHASYCLKKIATSLQLESSRNLFKLFAPQLLYTWLGEDSIENIPFEIFGYTSLEGLLKHAQSEAAAIMMMRGHDQELVSLARHLGLDPVQLVQRSFSKVLAAGISYDVSTRQPENAQKAESRIRKLMGRELYLENVYINFTEIIAQFFLLIDQEGPVEHSWSKDESLVYAAEAMAEIKGFGHSEVELAPNQQPTFKAKHLSRELALLCSRTEYELPSLWTPALVVSVARTLFNLVHTALGPLHTCSVIRRVRVLVCLAGSHAWDPYPLQMLLQTLRPFLVDPECADDSLGMTQYLLVRGLQTLTESPSFLAGYALSTLASLRVFLESSQASTTQESQFKATMSKAQKFHSWFTKYLEQYQSPLLEHGQQTDAFKAITYAASHVRSSGNAEQDTHESNLLLEILRDEGNKTQLLSETSRKIALGILCKDFHIPDSFRSDAVNSDEDATAISTAVWKSSSQTQSIGDDYLAWAARVVGRSFSASGDIDLTLLRESHLTDYLKRSSGGYSSEQGLLNLMQSLTGDIHCFTAGIVESSLRTIVSEAAAQEDNDLLEACGRILSQELLSASDWLPYRTPPSDNSPAEAHPENVVFSPEALEDPAWAQHVTIHLIQSVPGSIILDAMPQVLEHVPNFAEAAFPFIIHLVLLAEHGQRQSAKKSFSAALREWLKLTLSKTKDNLSLIINMLLFLRTRKFPGESSIADRSQWMDIDLSDVASAAARCGMHKTALLFIESSANEGSRHSRRSSAVRAQESTDVLLDIFENINDPDAYYGLPTSASLDNVLARLDYEKNGSKSLAFRGAQHDSHIRKKDPAASSDGRHLVSTLSNLGLAGLSHSLLQSQQSLHPDSTSVDNTFNNARRLEIWNIPAPPLTNNPAAILYKAYQGCYQAVDMNIARQSIYSGLKSIMRNAVSRDISKANVRHNVAVLAALTELDDILHVADATELDDILASFEARSHWMKSGRYADVMQILSCRETTLSMLGHTLPIRSAGTFSKPETRLAEVKSMLLSSNVYRFHQATQESLNIATMLNGLISPSSELGLVIDAAAKLEAANALWDHQEMVSSIRMLQSIEAASDLKKQTVLVQRSDLLAKIGHQVSVAKLEKPDNIQKNYLQPALKELRGRIDGQEAGKVYHQFAMFCDEQLQNPDSLEDLARLQHLRKGKNDEVVQLKGLVASAKESQLRTRYQSHLTKAKQWLDLDDQELRRVEQSRSEFVRLSLENYLLSLTASDEHNNDALRFTALWLERSGEDMTNEAVKRYIDKVPTRKFAALMNQLSSRLVDQSHPFQRLLIELVYRICVDHPYHGMYQIWSGMRSRTNNKDDVAVLRQRATEKVGKKLGQTQSVSTIWTSIDKTSKSYHMLATERDPSRYKAGQKIAIKNSSAGLRLLQDLTKYQIPPPTMQIELSADKVYSRIPYVTKLEDSMSIASGVSAPKIITLVGSNGERYKQLVKGGSDDLRQDAIMEQVFAAASSVLKLHRSTQQRNLGIRTYKVLPLTASSGLIEFVPNTIPFHEYLMPAHERYHPKDYKGSQCRKEISQVQHKSVETRVSTYKKVTERFQPVMRYFFMENFSDPDEWYAKRTAYTRTTAAISILGHVLGLGDRHGHNILLDSVTGEVVHIDLGVAFEMGRILPVPELVPFRLTRDIVDGMGITKTEGAFRRCCEFTLDALREETYTIMTILDVLRYDPLYSWSISPVRMAKLQTPRTDEGEEGPTDAEIDSRKKRGVVNEPSEADRALEVVRKKLSKTLSVTATVNDLINQATDERNLAVLYSVIAQDTDLQYIHGPSISVLVEGGKGKTSSSLLATSSDFFAAASALARFLRALRTSISTWAISALMLTILGTISSTAWTLCACACRSGIGVMRPNQRKGSLLFFAFGSDDFGFVSCAEEAIGSAASFTSFSSLSSLIGTCIVRTCICTHFDHLEGRAGRGGGEREDPSRRLHAVVVLVLAVSHPSLGREVCAGEVLVDARLQLVQLGAQAGVLMEEVEVLLQEMVYVPLFHFWRVVRHTSPSSGSVGRELIDTQFVT